MNKIDLIIQARMGSSRLPGKSLFDLAGKPLVYRIIERVKRCKNLDDIILAIPDNDQNRPLEEIAIDAEIKCFKGSEEDLVERYLNAANLYKTDYICRLPADNPIPEPSEIDKMISFHLSLEKKGFSSNLAQINNSGYPDGIGIEIFSTSLLKYVSEKYKDPQKREHVHLNFYNYDTQEVIDAELAPVNTINCPIDFRRPDIILDVNTYDQYLFIKQIYDYFYYKNKYFSIREVIYWIDNIYRK